MKIVLIGFMGSGKTSVANRLAKELNLKSIDMDEMLLQSSGYESINEIFEKNGERYFRILELEVARRLEDLKDVVISTGGGVVSNKKTITPLCKNSVVIYLKLTFDTARKRVLEKKIIPPLFQNIIEAEKLFIERESLYAAYADIVIDTNKIGINEALEKIIVELEKGKYGR